MSRFACVPAVASISTIFWRIEPTVSGDTEFEAVVFLNCYEAGKGCYVHHCGNLYRKTTATVSPRKDTKFRRYAPYVAKMCNFAYGTQSKISTWNPDSMSNAAALMRAQQSLEPTRTSFIIDGVAVDEDKLCSLDELSLIAHGLLSHVYFPIYYRRILPKLQLSRIQQMLIVLLRLRLHRKEISLY